jgi:hypothetical protein
VHGFVDESQRGRTYYVGAVLVPTSALASCRRALRQLLCRGERRIHFNNEASARRRELLSAMVRLEARAWIYHPRPPAEAARQRCLRQLHGHVVERLAPAGIADDRAGHPRAMSAEQRKARLITVR